MDRNCKKFKQFLLTYKQYSHLWDVSHKDYLNRKKRLAALQDLRPLLGENATVETVRKKIDILRTNYFREWRKVQASKATASDTSDIYTPTLWYYNLLSFLSRNEVSKHSKPTDRFDETETENKSYLHALLNESSGRVSSPIIKKEKGQSTKFQEDFPNVKKSSEVIKKEKRQSTQAQDENATKKSLEKPFNAPLGDNSFGLYISQQLQKVPNEQSTFAEKLMSDILFMARTNQLNITSQIITPLQSGFLSDNSESE